RVIGSMQPDSLRPPRPARLFPLAVAIVAVLALGAGSARADIRPSSASIEGTWTYKGGKGTIGKQPDGTYRGGIVAATGFERCTHEPGELIWEGIKAQADGSYFGLHQWFYDTSSCPPNPTLGLTGFRVLHHGHSKKLFLRVCLSEPDSPEQPTVGPHGEEA